MNIPWVQAKGEGEAQAAYRARSNDVWTAGSQDFDALLFSAPRMVRNLTITGRRKLPRKQEYVEVKTELVDLAEMLQQLELTPEQLIDIGILVGTDYHPGVKGVGPRRSRPVRRAAGPHVQIAPRRQVRPAQKDRQEDEPQDRINRSHDSSAFPFHGPRLPLFGGVR